MNPADLAKKIAEEATQDLEKELSEIEKDAAYGKE